MRRIKLQFSECEHFGDAELYRDDIKASGGTDLANTDIDFDNEECSVECSVDDIPLFRRKFQETDAYDFLFNIIIIS